MARQMGFAEAEYEHSKSIQKSRKALFLMEMNKTVPWDKLEEVIAPHYVKVSTGPGRPQYPLRVMLAIHLMQHWCMLLYFYYLHATV